MLRPFAPLAALLALCAGHPSMALADAADAARDEYERVMALTPDLDNGRRVYLTCAVCHRPEGWGSVDGAYPQIAGQAPAIIVKQLADIRAHNRDNPLMYPFSVPRILGGPQHLADVAAYVAGLPMTPHNGVGPGRDLDLGEQLYRDTCADCHGAQGEGNAQTLTPALAGQHYPYLLRQLEAMRVGRRKNAHEEMAARISAFTPREAAAVLDYAARLRPPADKVAKDGWLNPDFPAYVREPMGLPPMPPMPAPPAQPAVAPRSAGAGG